MAGFFQACGSSRPVELKELLLYQYHTLEFIEEMDFYEFLEFIALAKKREKDGMLFQQWLAMLPGMAKYMSFTEFRDTLTGANIDTRSTAEIVAELEQVHGKKKGELLNGDI